MKKLIILATFSTFLNSCAKPEAANNQAPISISGTDSLASKSPLMKASLPEEEESSDNSQKQEKRDKQVSTAAELQGKWVHESDSLAYLNITGSSWVSGYEGEEETQDNKYTYTLTDKLPQFVDPEVKAEFIVLSNKNDTMYYELNGVSKETLSLTYYPMMKLHVYKRKK
ncbi:MULTISPECIES: hypothetical protein [Rufibacter]|uniref:Lipocalin-like domain-containing protein n=1 Tax=Rufibacter quisquiliarum TaxID=1549639 RepID=A0A839GNA5_9BACT|nr:MULTISPECIES: hypothetical protein [Rufibacter]MBA9079413.1 hypothetical protein [Rufibacter quisquiliarum]